MPCTSWAAGLVSASESGVEEEPSGAGMSRAVGVGGGRRRRVLGAAAVGVEGGTGGGEGGTRGGAAAWAFLAAWRADVRDVMVAVVGGKSLWGRGGGGGVGSTMFDWGRAPSYMPCPPWHIRHAHKAPPPQGRGGAKGRGGEEGRRGGQGRRRAYYHGAVRNSTLGKRRKREARQGKAPHQSSQGTGPPPCPSRTQGTGSPTRRPWQVEHTCLVSLGHLPKKFTRKQRRKGRARAPGGRSIS